MQDYCTQEHVPIATLYCERDLGINISNNLKSKEQVDSAVAKANSMLGLLKLLSEIRSIKNINILGWRLKKT